MPAQPLLGYLWCPLAYAGKPHIRFPGTLAFTEEELPTAGAGTQRPHSDQHHTTETGTDDSNDTSSCFSSIYCVPGPEQAVYRHHL